jgi:hypothetical protein
VASELDPTISFFVDGLGFEFVEDSPALPTMGPKRRVRLTDQARSAGCQTRPSRATVEFIFAIEAEHPKAQFTARLTGDAGLHWQIDPDLHLEKLPSRGDW